MDGSNQSYKISTANNTVKNRTANILTKMGLFLGGLLILAILAGLVYFLLLETTPTGTIRDILIIFMAFELLVIGLTVILLIIQAARLVNLFQNEIKPLLEAANETMSTLRGTATFLGDTVVQPVIKFNSYLAVFRRMLDIFNIKR